MVTRKLLYYPYIFLLILEQYIIDNINIFLCSIFEARFLFPIVVLLNPFGSNTT